jgi:hypothetical protein
MRTEASLPKKSSTRKVTIDEARAWFEQHGGIGELPEGDYLLVTGKTYVPSTGSWFMVAGKYGLDGLWKVR